MEKEAYYFPHFCNARHDRKIRRLRKELGVEGYGIYFMLLETLREQQDLMYPLEDLDLLAEEFGVSEAKVKVTVLNYELFEIDGDQKFFSPRMLVYLEPYFRMKEQRKMAGQRSAELRKSNNRSTAVQQSKGKEKKGNESKVNESKEKDNEIVDFITFRDQLFNTWFDYKRQKKSSYTEIGKATLMKQWEGKTDDQLQMAIEHSIANNYQGLFEPKNNNSVIAEKKGKIQTNLENINAAQQAIKHNMKDGKVINNPFDISNWS
jgi:hypothetical protein